MNKLSSKLTTVGYFSLFFQDSEYALGYRYTRQTWLVLKILIFLLLLASSYPQHSAALERVYTGADINPSNAWGYCANWNDSLFQGCPSAFDPTLSIRIAKRGGLFPQSAPVMSWNTIDNIWTKDLIFDSSLSGGHELNGKELRVSNGILNQSNKNIWLRTDIELGDTSMNIVSSSGGQLWVEGNIRQGGYVPSPLALLNSTLEVQGNVKLSGDNNYGHTFIHGGSRLEIAHTNSLGGTVAPQGIETQVFAYSDNTYTFENVNQPSSLYLSASDRDIFFIGTINGTDSDNPLMSTLVITTGKIFANFGTINFLYGSGFIHLGNNSTYVIGAPNKTNYANLILNAGTTYYLNQFTDNVGSIEGEGNIINDGPEIYSRNYRNEIATFDGVISGSGAFHKGGLGTQVFRGANTYTGDTIVSAGTLLLAANEVIADTSSVRVGGQGQLIIGQRTETVGNLTGHGQVLLQGNGTLKINQTTDQWFQGSLTDDDLFFGTSTFNKGGPAELILSGTSTIDSIQVSQGSLRLAHNNVLKSDTKLTIESSARLDMGATAQNIGQLDGAGEIINNDSTLNVIQDTNSTFSGSISGAGLLQIAGSGELTLTGVNSYSGGTNLFNTSHLKLGNNERLADESALWLRDSSVFDMNGYSETIGELLGTGSIINNSGNLTVDQLWTGLSHYHGEISGSGGLRKHGAGTLELLGKNSYTGTTEVGGGTLQVGDNERISNSSDLIVHTGGTFNVNGFTETVGNVEIAGGTLLLNSGRLNLSAMTVSNGGTVDSGLGFVGAPFSDFANSLYARGGATITGTGSQWQTGELFAGQTGAGTLTVSNGGRASSVGNAYLGVYDGANGVMNVNSGGRVATGGSAYLGYLTGSSGAATVGGGNSRWDVGDSLFVGGLDATRNATGTLTVNSGGTVDVANTLQIWNGGDVSVQGGALNAATIDASLGGFTLNDGRLAVDTFIGDLVNQGGTLAPGNSPGITTIIGNYAQNINGILNIEIGGLVDGSEFDLLNVTGTASLAGTLDVDLIDLGSGLFTPGLGDSFDILTADTVSGDFDTLLLAVLDGNLGWDVSYLIDAIGSTDVVRLSVVASPVPIPATVWMLGCGLVGLIGISRRKAVERR